VIHTLGAPERLEDGLVTERVLAALHHQLQIVVDAVGVLFLQNQIEPRQKTATASRRNRINWELNDSI
jgi:hypothetical protein